MNNLGLFALIVFAQFFSAQTMRFVYQTTTMPDSTDLKSVKTELANLDIGGGKSIFYGQTRLKRDSIMQRSRETKSFIFDRTQMENLRSNVNYVVEKDFPNQTLVYKDRIGRDQYSYPERATMVWKIFPETTKIGDYKAQKAETQYGGRIWEVWFATDLPYQDGPYKFSGLPGLIVKVQDKDGEYSFDLIQVKKIEELPTFESRGQNISLTRDQFLAMRQKFKSDPEGYMQAERNSGGGPRGEGGGFGGRRGGPGGGAPDPNAMKEMRNKMVQDIRSSNNPIELK